MMPKRYGFSLIELLIAITLSMVTMYAAFAALRVATQTLTICNRMSTENNLLRTGFMSALEDLDYWTTYDNPDVPSEQPLRTPGLPFAPLAYDPDFRQDDPKTWWRNFGYASNSKRWGKYENFSRLEHADPARAWLPTQLRDINEGIGHYGMVDYLPGNTIYSYYRPDGKVPDEFWKIDIPANGLTNPRAYSPHKPKGVADDTPRDIWKLMHASTYVVTTNKKYRDIGYHRSRFIQGAPAPWGLHLMQSECRELRWLLPENNRPSAWPSLSTDVRRYVAWCHLMDVCTVEINSPLTGQAIRFSLWAVGTTLRGARQQRGLDTWTRGTFAATAASIKGAR